LSSAAPENRRRVIAADIACFQSQRAQHASSVNPRIGEKRPLWERSQATQAPDDPLVAAYLAGSSVQVPPGEVVGDDPDIAAWLDPEVGTIETPFVELPDLVTGRCVSWDGRHWLEVTVHGDPSDPRADDIGGDLTPEWGLHLVDVNLVIGDLQRLVVSQGEAWAAAP
jgi:hypothetical protein